MTKTIFITGSTDGIGKLTAQKLAADGNRVILHGRNRSKLREVISEIEDQTGNQNITGFTADLSDLDSIEKMTSEIIRTVTKIDVLINNAGVFKSPVATNKDGLDMRFMVNYLAPYLLTEVLIPTLKNGTNPRIINLSSAAQASVSIEALKGNEVIPAQEAYAQSKLALTMWSFSLAKSLKDIHVIAVNPGSLLNTKMVQEAYGHHWSPIDKGADILCDLGTSDTYSGVTGKYFDNDKGAFGNAHPDAYKETEIKTLIDTTRRILNL